MSCARIVLYDLRPGTVDFAIRNARVGLLPIFRQQAGFISYQVVKTGEASVISISFWETKAAAEDANRTAAEWAKLNLPDTIRSSKPFIAEVAFDSATAGQSPQPSELHS